MELVPISRFNKAAYTFLDVTFHDSLRESQIITTLWVTILIKLILLHPTKLKKEPPLTLSSAKRQLPLIVILFLRAKLPSYSFDDATLIPSGDVASA